MRVLHVVPYYLPAWRYGGPIRSVHGLCKGLARLGHDVHVFTTNIDGPSDLDVPIGMPVDIDAVKVWYFPSTHLRRLYWSPDLAQELKHQVRSFDLLHLHTIYMWPTTAAARIARRVGVPYVLAPRGMLVRDLINRKSRRVKKAWISLFERDNLANAASVHFTSRIEAEEAARLGFLFRTTCVVANGIDAEEPGFGEALAHETFDDVPENCRFLLFIGRVNWEKGLDRLIAALPRVDDCFLVVAGNDEEGYQHKLETLAIEAGVRERVLFLGAVHGPRKAALLSRAQALVLPSYSENFGNVVLEAMGAGCPVVVTPEVGAADIVRSTGAGVVLEGRPEAMAAGLNALLSEPDTLREMGDRAQSVIRQRYTWTAIAGEMDGVYRSIVAH
jgi:glycosyltransferase involved in cell wall biosynthesis